MESKSGKEFLINMAHAKMPYGKYKDYYLINISEYYNTWFKRQGFTKNSLGIVMEQMHEIKINGLDELIRDIKNQFPKD